MVEYVNKSNRGISNLHRELLKLHEANPEKDYVQFIKQLSLKLLNTVEMSSQETAWYLLRQPMSHSSRLVSYIPTVWPHERQKVKKKRSMMDKEGLDENSIDIWTKSVIQKYEERPKDLSDVCLADFVSWYTLIVNQKRTRIAGDELNDGNESNRMKTKRRMTTRMTWATR